MSGFATSDYLKNGIKVNACANKPFVLPAECTGNINITAEITELDSRKLYTQAGQQSQISSYAVLNGITLQDSESVDIIIDPATITVPSGTVTDYDLSNLYKIPAFYDYGNVTITYTVGDTDAEDETFDIKWAAKMEMASEMPTWYEGSYNYESDVMLNLIKGTTSEASVSSCAIYTTMMANFTIDTWNGIPPFTLGWYAAKDANGNTTTAVHRALLTPMRFKLTATNNKSDACKLAFAKVDIVWSYRTDNTLMNVRTDSNAKKQTYAQIYTLPKGSEKNRQTGLNFPLYGITSGFQGYENATIQEIVKVYAFYDKWATDQKCYFPTCVQLQPVDGMIGSDFPTILWKVVGTSSGVTQVDYERMAYHGMDDSSDYLKVITPQLIAADEHYRTTDVEIVDGESDNSFGAIFRINTTVNTDIDDPITEEELLYSVDYLKYFNITTHFATQVEIPRGAINPIFYEKLYNTYRDSTVLQSILDEPLYFIEFSVNDYASTWIPIYNGGQVQFSDQLNHCIDGTRSSEIFQFNKSIPNRINIRNPTKHKYRVKFNVEYDVYKDIYVIGSDAIVWSKDRGTETAT